ncbi:putative RNA polymerase I second largest subunit [Trypanosoma rangeli]|uniref:DNA-directed RNA polymerase subunit beta n=1 Tax=Trypanosoma rangeli TaxID=5698 RepID=A0A422NX41_TRYRA|nr:putative RNA polymerase I second largest subunit [Trypanosoma rangeli]RNF10047.1 putative RNA polymerase I second largest subunit [Trypanosoma rangeli]|eukprot:RNF10047.1 putative RNA polymerase I second largest subunit [Trypanosoma rangeli]
MSTKSSLRSSRSHASSVGENYTSTQSCVSSRHRRQQQKGDPPLPPAMMTSLERLQLIRNALTRLQYVGERQLHSAMLDNAAGEEVLGFFDKLRERLPKLEYNPRKLGTPDGGGPKQLHYMREQVLRLKDAATAVISTCEAQRGKCDAVYEGLSYNHLREVLRELEEVQHLLSHAPSELPSRVNTDLLADLVSFHITDFDAFAEQRVEAFVCEAKNEGALFTAVVNEVAQRAPSPMGLVSVFILDVAIGVRPGRCARIVIDHAQHNLTKLDNRLHTADAVLAVMTPEEDVPVEVQRRELSILKDRVKGALAELLRLKKKWEEEELSTLDRAASGQHLLSSLVEMKRLKEAEIIEEAQQVHDRAVHACLACATPQYYRCHSETYAQPCHVRLGFKFLQGGQAGSQAKSVTLYTLMPEFLLLMRQHNIPMSEHERYAALVPSKDHVWISFSEFPEMVRGARCSLRGVDTRHDHFRALEEQKEVGGYFIMRGGERILRALLMQRCNVPLNIYRERFSSQGPFFSPKAVVIRCKRPSGLTIQNYFYYITTGEVVFSFARKVVWHIPVPLLLFALNTRHCSSLEIYKLLTIGFTNSSGAHMARVEALLQHHHQKPYGSLVHFLDYIAVLGRMYRSYHETSNTFHFLPQFHATYQGQHDAWYGLFMLRRHVLPHLNFDEPTPDLPPTATLEDCASWLSPKLLQELDAKLDTMIAILRQLYDFFDGNTEHQGNDVPSYQEIFTVSQVLMGGFEVCLNKYMKSFVYRMGSHIPSTLFQSIMQLGELSGKELGGVINQLRQYTEYSERRNISEPLDALHRLLITGNLTLDREEDFYCPQTSGWVVMAEHLNFYRFFEQLRCLHRGKTIAEMRSSEVRKYPCEAFGFICMVHSPDGADCGVLNHMSISTIVSNTLPVGSRQEGELLACIREEISGLRNSSSLDSLVDRLVGTVPVWLEGRILGYLTQEEAQRVRKALLRKKALRNCGSMELSGMVRRRNVNALNAIEVVFVPPGNKDPQGLYIFYDNGRMMRPVQQLESTSSGNDLPFPLVYVGTWEQTWLDIASVPSDLVDGVTQLNSKYEFMEQNGSNILSLTATTIPFFEHNCSPRNLFQCGLSKQSAGTQLQALAWRKEAKLFRMYSPQRYISRTLPMDYYSLDDVNLGVNAVIAILAYTGYDLDDAVIVNSTASQFGMLNAGITVAKVITATGKGDKEDVFVFQNLLSNGQPFTPELDAHGLPKKRAIPGTTEWLSFDSDHKYPSLRDNSAVYCCAKRYERVDPLMNKKVYEYTRHHVTKWRQFDKGENGWVHSVIPLTYDGPDPTSALVVFRIPRPPAIGDKFSSRHGQKGTLPLHIRAHDLPFSTRGGITPDIIINPHAFPSRMTVGMVLEMMGAKLGAIQGRFCDHSAWSVVDERPRFAEVIGDSLQKAGYNRYGRERLIDGISGEEMEADVFMGISGYQRLRHMVNDKWQARARTDAHTHRAVTKTGQPVKGRKRHGGVRVGEMERDGLLSHGSAEVVVDRLLHVSDKTKAFICVECGSLLSIYERHATEYSTWKTCNFCGAGSQETTDTIAFVEIPQVLRLWAAELTSIGIRIVLKTSDGAA